MENNELFDETSEIDDSPKIEKTLVPGVDSTTNIDDNIETSTMNFGAPVTPIINDNPVVDKESVYQEIHEKSRSKAIIIIVVIIAVLTTAVYLGFGTDFGKNITNSFSNNKNNSSIVFENNTAEIEGKGAVIENGNLVINKGGTYTFSGNLNEGCIVIDTKDDVTVVLNGININSTKEAAIISKSIGKLTITTNANTDNKINAAGSETFDGAIYSKGSLVINGAGILNINSTVKSGISIKKDIVIESGILSITSVQDGIISGDNLTINNGTLYINSQGDGIYSNKNILIKDGRNFIISGSNSAKTAINVKNSYQINGGILVALGNGVMIKPSENSAQKIMLFNLNNAIPTNSIVSLADKLYSEIITFKPNKAVKTVIISTPKITENTYKLYTGTKHEGALTYGIFDYGNLRLGTEIKINNKTEFRASDIVNWFGTSNKS